MGNRIALQNPPRRVVSLVPSQTELLYYLGLDEEVAGITKFCIHPEEWRRTKIRVGGTKKLDMAKITALNPDVIIGNKEENNREQIEELKRFYPVWMSDIHNLDDALGMIKGIGELVGKVREADELIALIQINFKLTDTESSQVRSRIGRRPSAAYFIWRKPLMVAGKDTFINHMMHRCNFRNVFEELPERYPVVTPGQIIGAKPEFILLSTEPYPFAKKHIAEFRDLFPKTQIMIVNGEYFSWYGSRLADTPQYLNKLLKEIERYIG